MKKMIKKLASILLAAAMVVTFIPIFGTQTALAESSGTCGNNVTWSYSDGTLTISGSGEMTDFPDGDSAPWLADYRYSIKSVIIGNGVTSIGDQSFNFCNQMTSISIPSSVTRIGNSSFYYCSSLPEIRLPSGLTSIGERAFACCMALNTMSLPNSVTSIGGMLFNNCSGLKEVTFPGSLTSIGNNIFPYCGNLETVVFSEGMTSIGYDMCKGCPKLKNVLIPSTVKTIGNNPFSYCPSLTNISIASGNQYFTVDDGVLFNKDKTKLVACPDTKDSYVIPSTVTSIGPDAFMGCGKLQSLSFTDNITEIGSYAFRDCGSLQEVMLPSGLAELRDGVFYDCSGLLEAVLPEGLERMNFGVFSGCSNLETVAIPDSVERIGAHTFSDCKKLEDITIPEGVKNIEYYVFSGCESLQAITIPQSVTDISYYVFDGCTNLKEIKFLGNAPAINGAAFSNLTASALYPKGNETWTESVLRSYGGNITWEAYAYDLSLCTISSIPDQSYTGNQIEPPIEITIGSRTLVKDTDYCVSCENNTIVGTAKVTITGINNYSGTVEKTFEIIPAKVNVPSEKKLIYNGKAQTGVASGKNYTISGNTGTAAGTYTATLSLNDKTNYVWSDGTTADKKVKWTIAQAANPLKISPKTATVKYSKLKKKTQTLAVTKVIKFTKQLKDKKTYTLVSAKKGSKSFKKYFKINKTTGKVTIKKNSKMKKGTYKVKVKVKAAGNANYKPSAEKTVTFKVKVK